MTRQITSLLRRIVGRIRENMAALYMTVMALSIPAGLYLLVEGSPEDKWVAMLFVITGLSAMIMAGITVQHEISQARKEKQTLGRYVNSCVESILTSLKDIHTQLVKMSPKEKGVNKDDNTEHFDSTL